ncbi:MAG: histidine phosphatase family protein [Motiliproteus sp.]|nr:histidine phosphatase family protein [Motiliproteus sp.]MCW9051023.1 histidine phosphatase family protein [Motiliproteus sp.]
MNDDSRNQSVVTTIDLLRHGACRDGAIYRGRTDSLLSDEGELQMQRGCQDGRWQRIYSSPLSRCCQFAYQLSEQQQVPLAEESRLMELDFGDWDGCLTEEVWRTQQQAVLAFWQDPVHCPPPGGESLQALRERCVQLLHDLHRDHRGERLLLVTHGGVIRVLLGYLLQMPNSALYQLSIGYGSLSRIELYQGEDGSEFGSEVIFLNRMPSLQGYENG